MYKQDIPKSRKPTFFNFASKGNAIMTLLNLFAMINSFSNKDLMSSHATRRRSCRIEVYSWHSFAFRALSEA